MDYEIVWTEAAIADFEEFIAFVADGNPISAEVLGGRSPRLSQNGTIG